MATSENQMADGAAVELNPAESRPIGENLDPVPGAPAESASVGDWVDYCVDLGADRTFLTEETVHHDHMEADGQTNAYVTEPKLTKAELQDLAKRLGG